MISARTTGVGWDIWRTHDRVHSGVCRKSAISGSERFATGGRYSRITLHIYRADVSSRCEQPECGDGLGDPVYRDAVQRPSGVLGGR